MIYSMLGTRLTFISTSIAPSPSMYRTVPPPPPSLPSLYIFLVVKASQIIAHQLFERLKYFGLKMNKMILCVRFELTTAIMNFVCCMLNCERLWDERCWLHQHWTESTAQHIIRSFAVWNYNLIHNGMWNQHLLFNNFN